MDALACMKSLLLAASQYRTAKTPPNAALLQRSLEVRAAPALGPPQPRWEGGGAAGNAGLPAVSARSWGTGGSSRGPASAGSSPPLSPWRRRSLGRLSPVAACRAPLPPARPGPAASPVARRPETGKSAR